MLKEFLDALEQVAHDIKRTDTHLSMGSQLISIDEIAEFSPRFNREGVTIRNKDNFTYTTRIGSFDHWKQKIVELAQKNAYTIFDTYQNGVYTLIENKEIQSFMPYVADIGIIIFDRSGRKLLTIRGGKHSDHTESFRIIREAKQNEGRDEVQYKMYAGSGSLTAAKSSKIVFEGKVINLNDVELFSPYNVFSNEGIRIYNKQGTTIHTVVKGDYDEFSQRLTDKLEQFLNG